MKRIHKGAIGALGATTIALTLGFGMAGPASASALPTAGGASNEARSYSDQDVVALFVNGSGPIATSHPEIAERIGFVHGQAGITDAGIETVTAELKKAVPGFTGTVTKKITSGNPFKVEAGLRALEGGLNSIGAVHSSGDVDGRCAVTPIVSIDVLLFVASAAAYDNAALWKDNAFWLAAPANDNGGTQELAAAIAVGLQK